MVDQNKLRLAATKALRRLAENNREYIAGPSDDPGTSCIGYVEALVRVGQEAGEGAYQFVASDVTPGSIAVDDGLMPPKEQRSLIRKLELVEKAQVPRASFCLPPGFKPDDNSPFDSLRLAGTFMPSSQYSLDSKKSDRPDVVLDRYNREYDGKLGPHVGATVNLIAYMMMAGLGETLKEPRFQNKYLGQLLVEGKSTLLLWPRENPESPLIKAKVHEWSSSVPDMDDPSAPPLALIYTIARHVKDDCLTDDAIKRIHRNTVAAAFDCFNQYHLEPGDEKWTWAGRIGLARYVFSTACDGVDPALVKAWSKEGDQFKRESKARDLFERFARRKGSGKIVADFLLRHLYLDDGTDHLGESAQRRAFYARGREGKHLTGEES